LLIDLLHMQKKYLESEEVDADNIKTIVSNHTNKLREEELEGKHSLSKIISVKLEGDDEKKKKKN